MCISFASPYILHLAWVKVSKPSEQGSGHCLWTHASLGKDIFFCAFERVLSMCFEIFQWGIDKKSLVNRNLLGRFEVIRMAEASVFGTELGI